MKGIELLEYIKDHSIVTISSLATSLNISEATARRRLHELEDGGLITLIRGGQINVIDQLELSVDDVFKQKAVSLNQKLSAQIAANYIKDGDIVFIDNGTTVREILKHLEAKNVKIYTNGVYHMLNNRRSSVDINIIPGQLLVKEASIVGAEAISYLSTLAIDKAFIGINGYDQNGVYTPHRREMVIKEFALRTAKNGYLVTDSSKQGTVSKYKICELDEYPIITEKSL